FTQNWFDQKWVKMPTQQIEIQVQVFQDFGGQNIEYNRFKQFFYPFLALPKMGKNSRWFIQQEN
ncbi:MAG: hypothetical protein PVI19_14820, partial [Syntrophobacterales bacterium]